MPIFPLSSFDVLRLSESWLLGNSSKNMVSSLFSLVTSILVCGFHLPSPTNTHPVRNRQVLLGGSRWPQQLCSGHGRWLLHLSGFRSAPGRPGKGPFHFHVVDKGTWGGGRSCGHFAACSASALKTECLLSMMAPLWLLKSGVGSWAQVSVL